MDEPIPSLSDAAAAASLYARRATQAAKLDHEAFENVVKAASEGEVAARHAATLNPSYAAAHHYDAAILHERAADKQEDYDDEETLEAARANRKAAELHRRASGVQLILVKKNREAKQERDAKHSPVVVAVKPEMEVAKSMDHMEPNHLATVEAHMASTPLMVKTPGWLIQQLTGGTNDYGFHGTAYDCSKASNCAGAMVAHHKQAMLHESLAKMMRNGIMAGGDSTAGEHEVAAELNHKACCAHQGGMDGAM